MITDNDPHISRVNRQRNGPISAQSDNGLDQLVVNGNMKAYPYLPVSVVLFSMFTSSSLSFSISPSRHSYFFGPSFHSSTLKQPAVSILKLHREPSTPL